MILGMMIGAAVFFASLLSALLSIGKDNLTFAGAIMALFCGFMLFVLVGGILGRLWTMWNKKD